MGFFSSDRFTKPGPGVGKNEPQKRRIVVFFELFFRQFGKLHQVNLLFLLFSLPSVVLFFLINYVVLRITSNALIVNFLTFLPFAALMIPMSGMTYVVRNYARDEHAFSWFDFTDQMKKNWKQSLIHGVVSYVAYFIAYYTIMFYWNQASKNWFFAIPCAILILLVVFFTFAQYYILPMIVTFDLPYKNIVKNGFLFSIMAFLRNFLQTILHVIVWGLFLIFMSDTTGGAIIVGVLMLLTGIPVYTSFLINFTCYPVLVKYMIKPMYGEQENTSEGEFGKYAEGDHYKPLDENEEKPEYVFENGRLVRRMDDVESVFEDQK